MSEEQKSGWFARLKQGLSKTSGKLSDGITGIFTKRKLDANMLGELEELLIEADMGAATAAKVAEAFGEGRFDKEIAPDEVKQALAGHIASLLAPVAKPLDVVAQHRPHVILVVGVNGNGKTTTIGKMARLLKGGGWKVMMAAADTFRAAAVEQLKVWGVRNDCVVITGPEGSDPASVVFKAMEEAKRDDVDVLLIDSAGRLHNKNNLMAELQKIVKVIKKINLDAPHDTILVLDATTGQNAIAQVEAFKSMVGITGLVVTKLDGTAKGGVVVALADKFGLPIYAVGVGEAIEDLRSFDAEAFAANLVGAA